MNICQFVRRVVVSGCLIFLPATAWAQAETGNIAGVVRDASGAVMPGVTVEAASPVLIEKIRVVATDGQGLYKIVDLRPGVYTLTFTLTGFNTFRREGVELTTGVLDAVMTSKAENHRRVDTPHLETRYKATDWPFATDPVPKTIKR